ncbi:HdeD family acid-resistance protein [Candidatus Nitrosocosmicus sp. T]
MSIDKSPVWVRAAQIGLGIIILILSIVVLLNPVIGGISIIFILALLLFFAGIEKVVSGIIGKGKSRFANIALGIIVIIISLIAMTYPVGATVIVVVLLGIALLVDGISRIIHGLKSRKETGKSNLFGMGVGALEVIFAIAVIVIPNIGIALAGILIGIALLITSIQIIYAGVTGRSRSKDTLTK